MSRNAFLRVVQDHFPSLLAWNTYCHGGEAPSIWNGDHVLRSVTGVQNWDSLGPFLFAIALRIAVRELQNSLTTVCSPSENVLFIYTRKNLRLGR